MFSGKSSVRLSTAIMAVLAITALCGEAAAEAAAVRNGVAVEGAAAAHLKPRPAPAAREISKSGDCDIFIDFDDAAAPCFFLLTTRLTDAYAPLGVHFAGPSGDDGGAVLDECGLPEVTGYSSPNFLAFNTGAALSDGGVPQGPERISFDFPIWRFSAKVGGNAAGNVTLTGFDPGDNPICVDIAPVQPDMVEIDVIAGNIAYVEISFTSPYLIVDDICISKNSEGHILLFVDTCGAGQNCATPALANLGLSNVTRVESLATLSSLLNLYNWELVIIDEYNNELPAEILNKLQTYYSGGGRVILFAWDLFTAHAAHPLWAHLGICVLSEYLNPKPVYDWGVSTLFTTPNAVPNLSVFENACMTDGQNLDVTTGLPHAGYTASSMPDEVAIASDPDIRFIVNAFAPQTVYQDADSDGKHDMVELYENEIAHVLRGSGVLLYTVPCGGSADFAEPALQNLGLPYTKTESSATLLWQLQLGEWDLVIVDEYNLGLSMDKTDQLLNYYDSGARIIFSSFNLGMYEALPFMDRTGASYVSSYVVPVPIFPWRMDFPFFTTPNEVPALMDWLNTCATDGHYLEPIDGWDIAGYTPSSEVNQTALILNTDGRLILNGFMPGLVNQDDDGDGKQDMVELYENEIYFMIWTATYLCIPIGDVVCDSVFFGTTIGMPSEIDFYPYIGWNESGPEAVYSFTPIADAEVIIDIVGLTGDLDIFVLEDVCPVTRCIAHGDTMVMFSAVSGITYFIVVDGFSGAASDFAMLITCVGSEGEGEGESEFHSADQNHDNLISLSELLRVIQFYNSGGYHCADPPESTEDGYVPGPGADHACTPHASDYNPQNWMISLSELLRVIQFYNSGGYYHCPLDGTEDGFCPGHP